MKRFVLFGDSLTQYSFDPDQGWGAAIAHKYQRRIDVVNRGFSGYNTKLALPELHRLVLPLIDSDTLVTTVFFGANDAALPFVKQHLPLAEYRKNLTEIVSTLKAKNPAMQILVINPPPVYRPGRIRHQRNRDKIPADSPDPEPDRNTEHTGQYATAALEVAREQGVASLDLFHGLQEKNANWGPDYLGVDGLHFTPAGQRAVGELVMGALDGMGYADVEAMKMPAPWWGDLLL